MPWCTRVNRAWWAGVTTDASVGHSIHIELAGLPSSARFAYRRRHAVHKSDADLQAAHAAAPWVVVFDDHEVDNDWTGLPRDHPRVPAAGVSGEGRGWTSPGRDFHM